MFKSKSVTVHLLRGIVGAALFGVAFAGVPWWAAIPLVGGGVLFLGGCPMCWTIGLFETVMMNRTHDQSSSALNPSVARQVRPPSL